ncbi:MAG: CHASE2 domain-containing protein [Cyanobacteria bacterium J06560_6]
MNAVSGFDYHYQLGGSLPVDAPSYVVRRADVDLYQALSAGDYCYVLNARQMGKSSLRIQTMSKLQAEGNLCSEIELSGIGSQEITARQWYGGIIQELISGFGLSVNRRAWLSDRTDISPVQSLGDFIETVLLKQLEQNIFIFIDEIDSVLSLNFSTDEFFALIRNCYDKRATHPAYRRLTFAMIGVATPSQLIQDEHATPFNIGRAIELQGFAPEESSALAVGLVGNVSDPTATMNAILAWTGGQPFLTQKLCRLVVQSTRALADKGQSAPSDVAHFLSELVHTQILDSWEGRDEPEHLRTVRDRLLRHSASTKHLLKRYRTLLTRGSIPSRNTQIALNLRLSGLVTQKNGRLIVKNKIYQAVFDQSWIQQQLDKLSRREPRIPLWKALLVSAIAATGVVGLRSVGLLEAWELQAFDQLMRSRLAERPDNRLLLITITEEDVQMQPQYERGAASLSDNALNQLLTKLETAEPRAIGLDIYRDLPVQRGYDELVARLSTTDHLFAICQYGDPGVLPPPEVPIDRQGLNNTLLDNPDGVIRRQLLAVSDVAPCDSYYALSIVLAQHYLSQENIESLFTQAGDLQMGDVVFRPLDKNAGGYHNIENSGYQILLNYRASQQIADKVSLSDFLSDRFDPSLAKDRIVLIGTVAPSFNDSQWQTPLGSDNALGNIMAGIEVQAHMLSQLLSAVKDNRPLLWWWSDLYEALWIVSWSAVSGLLIWRLSTPLTRLAGGGCVVLVLYGCCWILLQQGGWVPLVPTVLAGLFSGSSIIMYGYIRRKAD